MSVSWHTIAIGQAFLIAVTILLLRVISREKKWAKASFVITGASTVMIFLLSLPVLPFLGPIDISGTSAYIPWLIGGGAAFGLSTVFIYKMLSHIEAGMGSIFSTIGAVFTVILAALILHEDLTSMQLAGTLVLLVAIIYMLLIARVHHRKTAQKNAWILGFFFSLLASLCFAIATVNEKFLLGKMSLATYILLGWGTQALMSVLAAVIIQSKKMPLLRDPKLLRLLSLGSLTRAAGGYLFLLSLIKSNNVALTSVVANLRLVFIVLLGALLLHERQRIKEKLAASVVALAGLSLIFWK